MNHKKFYRVQFITGKKEFDIKAQIVRESEFFGFLEIADIVLSDPNKIVITPDEDDLKKEFENSKRCLIPYQHIRRIDEYDGNIQKIISPFIKMKDSENLEE